MQLFALGGCKALLCDFSDGPLWVFPIKVESVLETLVIFPGVDFISVSGIIIP